MKKFISNKQWEHIYNNFIAAATVENDYVEAINFSFSFSPVTDYLMTSSSRLFNPKKAATMFFWYKNANAYDKSILDCFPEYAHCIDDNHKHFNSNYGVYAYKYGGLNFCVKELKKNHKSRRACFCINNNSVAQDDSEIDKLCTNAIQFFIRDARLEMIVQMRSSNFIKLLPYDAFMFSVFYFEVYKALKEKYVILRPGNIHMQIASLHYYNANYRSLIDIHETFTTLIDFIDFNKDIDEIEYKLKKFL